MQMTEEQFDESIRRILQGDRDGLKAIYEAYVSYIYALMKGTVGSRENAEDLTTDFFIKIWEKAGSYRPGNGHKAWMSTIARNMAIDYMRKNGRLTQMDEVLEVTKASDDPTPEEKIVGSLSFRETVDLLKDPDRMIVTMKIAGQMTFKEIAHILQMPVGTVTWKYNVSMKKLRGAVV